MIPASTACACVIDGVIAARGSKASMLSAVKAAKREGKDAFLGRTGRAVGERWS